MEAVWPRKRVSCPETPSSNSMRWICANFATKTPWGPSPMPATLSSWPWLGKILWWILAFSLQPASTRFNSLQLASTRSYPPSHPPCHPPPRFNPLQPALTRFNPLQPALTRFNPVLPAMSPTLSPTLSPTTPAIPRPAGPISSLLAPENPRAAMKDALICKSRRPLWRDWLARFLADCFSVGRLRRSYVSIRESETK